MSGKAKLPNVKKIINFSKNRASEISSGDTLCQRKNTLNAKLKGPQTLTQHSPLTAGEWRCGCYSQAQKAIGAFSSEPENHFSTYTHSLTHAFDNLYFCYPLNKKKSNVKKLPGFITFK